MHPTLAEELEAQHGLVVGIATIWCTIQHLGLWQKKVRLCFISIHKVVTCAKLSRAAAECCEAS